MATVRNSSQMETATKVSIKWVNLMERDDTNGLMGATTKEISCREFVKEMGSGSTTTEQSTRANSNVILRRARVVNGTNQDSTTRECLRKAASTRECCTI
jgi:hypothetical protein